MGYDLIDHKRVWEVIRRDVPTLRAQIATICRKKAGYKLWMDIILWEIPR